MYIEFGRKLGGIAIVNQKHWIFTAFSHQRSISLPLDNVKNKHLFEYSSFSQLAVPPAQEWVLIG